MNNFTDPLTTIQSWQELYNKNYFETPVENQTEKDELHKKLIKRATEHFADTICEFSVDLSPDELFSCLFAAAAENYNHSKKEYEHAKEFLNQLHNEK